MTCTQRKRHGGSRARGKKRASKKRAPLVIAPRIHENDLEMLFKKMTIGNHSASASASAPASAPPVRRSASRGPKSVRRSIYNPFKHRQTRSGRVLRIPSVVREQIEAEEEDLAAAHRRANERRANHELEGLLREVKVTP